MANLNAIILLDDVSKVKIKTNVSILGPHGFKFIDSLDEINDELLNVSHRVFILEGFMQRPGCISDLELYKELFNLKYFYLGADESWFNVMKDLASCFKCDISLLDFDTLQAAMFNDKALEDSEAECKLDAIQRAKEITDSESNYDALAIEMANALLGYHDKAEYLERSVNELKKRNSNLETLNSKIRVDRDLLLTGYKQILNETAAEQAMLKQYEAVFTSDVYAKVRMHDYSNRPMVIYFKEYEDFLNLDEMIETLFSVFVMQERKTVKVLRFFDSSTSKKMLTVPEYYTKLYNEYSMADVLSNDYVCKSGDYRRILDKVLLNETGVDILIVIDSKDYNDTILSGMPLQMNLCREVGHLNAFHLNAVNTLVNTGDEESKYFWGRYDTEGMTDEDKFLFLSSRRSIRNIVDLCHLFEESV